MVYAAVQRIFLCGTTIYHNDKKIEIMTNMQYIGFMKKLSIQKISRPTLRDQVYDTLKQNIVTLELLPEQKLNDNELAAQFGVSRTPVREALKRLEDEGLIESFPGAVTRVAPLHEEAAAHAFTVAAVLHGLAARLSISYLQTSHYDMLKQFNQELITALQQQDASAAIQADDQFHDVFIQQANNPEIIAALNRVMPKIRRLEYAKFSSIDHTHSPKDHRLIIEAGEAGDSSLAATRMEQNWMSLGSWLASSGNHSSSSTDQGLS